MSKKKTTEDFQEELKSIFPGLKVLEIYRGNKTKILVEDEIGIKYKSIPSDLIRGHYPSIKATVNKTDFFIKKSKYVHGEIYDYSNSILTSLNQKIKINCTKHGEFLQLPKDHMNGHGCLKCSREDGAWRKSEWKRKGNSSVNFTNYKLYLLKIYNEQEKFLKVGITFRNVEERIKPIKLLYNVDIIDYIVGDSDNIYKTEKYLKRMLKNNKYNPKNKFEGITECYQISLLDKLDNFFKI
jgi:hypothetical protein